MISISTRTSPAGDASTASSKREAETRPESPASGRAIVDVGIPTLGTSPYLVEAIESVFAQTHQEWRLVISENSPGLEPVRDALAPFLTDPRVQHVTTGSIIARAQNFTNVIRLGNAPYHGLLHDDDCWGPEFLERRVDFLEKHRRCGFVFSNYTVIDGTSHAIARTNLKLAEGVQLSSVLFPLLYRRMFIGVPSVLVRRSAYEAIGASYKDLFFADNEMWLKLAANFDAGYLRVSDAYYRFHDLQDSSDRTQLAKESLAVLDAVDDLSVPRRLRSAVRAETYTWCAFDAIERGDRREALKHLTCAARTGSLSLCRPGVAGRLLAGLIAVTLGARGRRAVINTRDRRWRSRRQRGISFAAEVVPVDADASALPGSQMHGNPS